MEEKVAKLLKERQERAAITLKNQKADRIPVVAWRSDYMVYYYGSSMAEMTSWDKMEEIYVKMNDEFDFDICDVMDPIGLTYPRKGEALKGTMYSLSEDGNCVQIIPETIEIMKPDEYDMFIKDPAKTMFDVFLPRRYALFGPDSTREDIFAGMAAYNKVAKESGEYRARVAERTGCLKSSHFPFSVPVDALFDFLRNFTGISVDIRRCPDKVAELCDVLVEDTLKSIRKAPVLEYSTITSALHLAPYIKPKDFEKVYWPSFKAIIETAHETGHVSKLLFEKSWKHLFDYIEELPKNSICGYIERDDGFIETEKRLGDKMIVVGGIDTNLLARGTKEECIASIKNVIDVACGNGGVMLAADIPMVYAIDAKPENFKATVETIRKYGNY